MSGSDETVEVGGDFTNNGKLTMSGTNEKMQISADFSNTGTLTLSGTTNSLSAANVFTNSSSVTVGHGAILSVGTYNQISGATLLNGGTLDPTGINITGGSFGGTGTVVGNVSVTGSTTTVDVGGASPGSLHVEGDYSQDGGSIDFTVGPNGSGGFLTSDLLFDPGSTVTIEDTDVVFDFADGADPLAYLESGEFNLDAFFQSSDGASFLSEFGLGNVFLDDTFSYETADGSSVGLNLDTATGDVTASETATPEPSTALLLFFGAGGLLSLRWWRRRRVLLKTGPAA